MGKVISLERQPDGKAHKETSQDVRQEGSKEKVLKIGIKGFADNKAKSTANPSPYKDKQNEFHTVKV